MIGLEAFACYIVSALGFGFALGHFYCRRSHHRDFMKKIATLDAMTELCRKRLKDINDLRVKYASDSDRLARRIEAIQGMENPCLDIQIKCHVEDCDADAHKMGLCIFHYATVGK